MISFIIPLYNEEKNCRPQLMRLIKFGKKHHYSLEIIAVDDRSSDKTAAILKELAQKHKNIRPIFRQNDSQTRGNTMGQALIEGTKKAHGEIIIWTMADLADDPGTYKDIIDKLRQNYDLVFASRYMIGGSRGNLDRLKAFLSSWGTKLARLLFAVPVHDITNAFRGFKKNLFDSLILESTDFSISPELAIIAHLAGFKLGEVPTTYSNRKEGVSNFKLLKMMRSYLSLYFRLFVKYKILR